MTGAESDVYECLRDLELDPMTFITVLDADIRKLYYILTRNESGDEIPELDIAFFLHSCV